MPSTLKQPNNVIPTNPETHQRPVEVTAAGSKTFTTLFQPSAAQCGSTVAGSVTVQYQPPVAANNNHIWDQCYLHPVSHQIQSLPLIPSCIKHELGLPLSQKTSSLSMHRIGNSSLFSDETTHYRELDTNNGCKTSSSSSSEPQSFFSSTPTFQSAASSCENYMQFCNGYNLWNEKVNSFCHSYTSGTPNSQNVQALSLPLPSLHPKPQNSVPYMAQPLQLNHSKPLSTDLPNNSNTEYGPQQIGSFFNMEQPSTANQSTQFHPYVSVSRRLKNDAIMDSLTKSLQTSLTVSTIPPHTCNDMEGIPPSMTNIAVPSKHVEPCFFHTRASSSDQVDLIAEGNWHDPYDKAMQHPSINVHPNGYSSVPNSPSKHRRMGSNNTSNNPSSLHINLAMVHNTTDVTDSNNGPISPSKKESTEDKVVLKEFQNLLKSYEPLGYDRAKSLTMNYLNDPKCRLANHMHWRVHMELADLAKRENLVEQARLEFCTVNKIQPNASQGWLEYAKLEEESGNNEKCGRLLVEGLDKCKHNESLLIKAIKHFEQNDDLQTARSILGRLKGQKPESCWKILLEGALLESRAGNVNVARKVFKYLMKNVHRHGPIYYEAFKLEEKCEQFDQALNIVEQGLVANPRYGPLWFAALRLYERKFDRSKVEMDSREQCLAEFRQCISRAAKSISKELKWKVYFELAQFEERASHLQLSRKAYSKSAIKALENLRWKVWLAGARTELNAGNIEISRMLLNRALQEVPIKTKAVVLIECARLEEFCNHLDKARDFLNRAKQEAKHEWKVFLESILLEMRAGNIEKATCEALEALQIHRGTGRLWAILIQLHHMKGNIVECSRVFKEALEEVPKSGEVWCEGARIALNPLSPKFSLEKAKRCLDFAIKFTPQYGDSFIEYLRLELLTRGPSIPNSAAAPISTINETQEQIENLCVNADPNYGPLWFHCKSHPLDSTRQVLRKAKEMLMSELAQQKEIYQHAIMNKHAKKTKIHLERESFGELRTFITGLCSLNQMYNNHNLSFEMRKKCIYLNEISV